MATGTPESSWTQYSPGPYSLNLIMARPERRVP